jgi:hypothetical protein
MSAVSRSRYDDALLARLQVIGKAVDNKQITQSVANKFTTNAKKAHREQVAALPQSTQSATAASHNTTEGDFYEATDDDTADNAPEVDDHVDEERQEHFVPAAVDRPRNVSGMARREWPAGASAKNEKAQTFPSFAAGKKAVAAAFKAGTLYDGVTSADFSERSRKHPGGAGDPQRGYCDWEVTENGGYYGCRFVKLTPMPMFTPHPHPTLTLATRLRNLHRRLLCTAPVQNFSRSAHESSPHLSRDGKWDLNGPCVLIYPVSTCETCLIPA